MTHTYQKSGPGIVPARPQLAQAATEFMESIPDVGLQAWIEKGMAKQLDFTTHGLDVTEVRKAFEEVLDASRKEEPVVESGNKYGVSSEFHKMNAELIMHMLVNTDMYHALTPKDQERSKDMFSLVVNNNEMRNRNPLHPMIVDSCVIGNLLNFPKHIFGFPFGSYATDGNESLSLVLFSYREEKQRSKPAVLFVGNDEKSSLTDIQLCVERLGMEFISITESGLSTYQSKDRLVAVLTSFESPSLGMVAGWCDGHDVPLHLHLRDAEWRNIFIRSKEPVHFDLPAGVRSITIEEGLLNCGYQLYRDHKIRDRHLDVGIAWQTAYMSPNEGGSGQSGPLLMDFCFILLGWTALSYMAERGLGFRPGDRSSYRLQPALVPCDRPSIVETKGAASMETILDWARASTEPKAGMSRNALETELICFQRDFLGGRTRELEALVTGGGTRSINLAFESVLKRAKASMSGPFKVITGNPHLAVERAERRFGFDLIRVDIDGAICLEQLKKELDDPAVVAVYSQTLSYTDGVTDPIPEIVRLVEEQNKKRTGVPVTLINDSCLAFTVLVFNDGKDGLSSMRVLDLTDKLITPTIVTLDAHKHLGTDKGVSTVVGTKGTLSNLKDNVKVGSQPSREELARAVANMWIVGRDGYYKQYQQLAAAVERVVQAVESVGMTVVHRHNRIKGSTVLGVEDPSGAMGRLLAKRGHTVAKLFGISRHNPGRCQSGWQVSFTPNALRQMPSGKQAVDVFIDDILDVSKKMKTSTKLALSRTLFKEDSLPACLISGNIDPFFLKMLHAPGAGRHFAIQVVRRYFTANLDSGIVRSLKRPALKPLMQTVKKLFGLFVAFLAFLLVRRRQAARQLKR